MALTSTDAEPIRSARRFGYAIKMMSGDEIVSVVVTDEALQEFASPPDAGIERLKQYRSQIEEIASQKHSAGEIESDGSVCVTSTDVTKFRSSN
jgi:hypothetical protein